LRRGEPHCLRGVDHAVDIGTQDPAWIPGQNLPKARGMHLHKSEWQPGKVRIVRRLH
jgi:hypothetical protein